MTRPDYVRAAGFLGTLAISVALFAQATGTIHGTISDASGAVVPGVAVTIMNAGTNVSRTVTADESGHYVAPLLPVGVYNVTVERPGFATFVQTGVTLQVNTNVEVNAALSPSATS
jgi:hypothetical protein